VENLLSRRQVIIGAATASLVAAIPPALAEKVQECDRGDLVEQAAFGQTSLQIPVMRYMAAVATLGDGRLLLSGGFSSRPTGISPLVPQSSAWLFDTVSQEWTEIAPMNIARARHASVQLNDGRVAVIGGFHFTPLSSIEVYDPSRNTWTKCESLAHPRYDHCAVSDGRYVYVIGGSCDAILGSMEVFRMNGRASLSPV